MLPLVLASSSPYRRELLGRLRHPFTWTAPAVDETPQSAESADALVRRLAEAKARALSQQYPAHLIIGSDQAAVLGSQILGKPHGFECARQQLLAASGTSVTFLTSLALLNSASGHCQFDAVGDPGRAELDIDWLLPVGRLTQLLDLDAQIVETCPVGMPRRRALVDPGR